MIPSKTLILTSASTEDEFVSCVAIKAVGGNVTFTTLEEGGVASPNEGATLISGETLYSWKKTFTTIVVATGTLYADFK